MRSTIVTIILSSTAFSATAALAKDHLIEIERGEVAGYSRELAIAPGKFRELCVALKERDRVDWRFTSTAEVDFNVHFHVGEAVRYPEKLRNSTGAKGMLVVESDQHYCWMWKAGPAPAAVSVALDRKP